MKCPKCGRPLRKSRKDPSYGLCDYCRKKFRLPDAQKPHSSEHPDLLRSRKTYPRDDTQPARQNRRSSASKKKRKKSPASLLLTFLTIFIILAALIGFLYFTKFRHASDTSDPISGKQFEQISMGMTYDKVKETVGSGGTKVSEYKENDSVISIYQWTASKDSGSALITFMDKKVIRKSQSGILETNSKPVDKNIYDNIDTGMTYDEVTDITGCDGELVSSSKTNDTSTDVYVWYGEDGKANMCITFTDDKTTGITQTGLK